MSNVDAVAPIQAALYGLLDAGLPEPVFDHVPEGAVRPYVVIGDATSVPDNALAGFGARTTETLHVWSDYHGYAEALELADRIVALLDHQPVTVIGHHTVAVRWEQTVPMRDPDTDMRHVAIRFAIITEYEP